MKAIVHKGYGRPGPGVLELGELDVPELEDHQALVRVHASSVNPVEWYGVTGPYFARLGSGLRAPNDPSVGADLAGTIEAVGKDVEGFRPGDEVYGVGDRRVGRARDGPRRPPRAQARLPLVRGGRGRSRGGGHRAPGAAGQGRRAGGAEGARQRRVRRRGDVRGAARQGVRRGGDCRLQHEERRAGPGARRRPRGRLHEGRLHEARGPPRAVARHRRPHLVPRLPAGADRRRDLRPDRRAHVLSRARPAAASRRARSSRGRAAARP